MITRAEILVLGLSAAVIGGLLGGILLFAGMNLVMQGRNIGWLLMLSTAPVCGGIGYWKAKRLADKHALPARVKK
jgi:hypothetical protein